MLTERELSEAMGVSRASVREALRILEFVGLIESKPKSGTNASFVNPDVLINRLTTLDVMSDFSIEDILEVKMVLEPKIIQMSVERATECHR